MKLLSPSNRRRKAYSVDRLRVAYADLLQHIDVVNADLGRRGIDEDDVIMHKKSKRFSFRRNVIPQNNNNTNNLPPTPLSAIAASSNTTPLTTTLEDSSASVASSLNGTSNGPENESRDATNIATPARENRDLAAAFRMLAATRSPDKEGDNFGAIAIREDSYVAALNTAKAIESRVVELVRTIGEMVVQADPIMEGGSSADTQQRPPTSPNHRLLSHDVRSDPVFEYFCEKSMLSLLVDIAKEKRQGSEEGRRWGTSSSFHGVVWSPLVKAQVFATAALLISECRNRSFLYYLLSHNYINQLIQCMMPLQQWTDQALSKMMPAYVDMLKKVAVQLADDPELFPFLTIEVSEDNVLFPLFSATLETATGVFAQSDSIVYGTCLVVAVNIMQIAYPPVQSWVCDAGLEQRRLADHLCQRLLDRYYRIVNLATGPVVDNIRSNAVAGQLAALKDHMVMIHEVFWSGVRGLDVRLCESLLQRVVTVLLKNLTAHKRRPFLSGVGLLDADVIPEQEALAQVSALFLALLFSILTYAPFQRMLAVALFHEKSTPLWSTNDWMKGIDSAETYIFMPLLSDIVTGDNDRETCVNAFRAEIFKGVSGQYGAWRATASACLLQSMLASEAVDDESLRLLNIIPNACDEITYQPTALEKAIASFLTSSHKPSTVTMHALECVGFLAIQLLHEILVKFTRDIANIETRISFILSNSPLWQALQKARNFFANEAKKCQQITGVSDIFLDLVESAICARYIARYDDTGKASFRCQLSQRGDAHKSMSSELLVRKIRSVSANDVETTRFFVNMTLHFRCLCGVIDRLCRTMRREFKPQAASRRPKKINLDLVDTADELTRTIGGLMQKPKIGSDLNLTGRMTFRFQSPAKRNDVIAKDLQEMDKPLRIRNLTEEMGVFRPQTSLMIVLDPTDIYIVRPLKSKVEENRATVLCSLSLRSVIAAADDGEWLHVAVRHEDVGFLIKNGNMALQFENNGACLIVKQYLDRSRDVLRQELLEKVAQLLKEASN